MDIGSIKQIHGMKIYLLILILVAIGTVGLFVVRMDHPQTGFKELHPFEDDEEKTSYEVPDYLLSTIPEHPPLEYDLESPKVMYPWKDDTNCSKFAIRLGKALPFVYLLSFPRSGNSWVRYLAECATGFFTGSVYSDSKLFKLGYLGENEKAVKGTTLLIKEHIFKQFDAEIHPAVLLIRNPMSAIESFVSFKQGKGNHTYGGSELDFAHLDKVFETRVAHWERVATLALNSSQDLLVVVYEKLKAEPINEIRKIMKFLIIPEDPERMACLAKYSEGPVNRGQPEYNPFTAEQIATMMEAVRRVNALVEERGFPLLPYIDQ